MPHARPPAIIRTKWACESMWESNQPHICNLLIWCYLECRTRVLLSFQLGFLVGCLFSINIQSAKGVQPRLIDWFQRAFALAINQTTDGVSQNSWLRSTDLTPERNQVVLFTILWWRKKTKVKFYVATSAQNAPVSNGLFERRCTTTMHRYKNHRRESASKVNRMC